MIQLKKDFIQNKPWGRQSGTVSLFMFLLSNADSEGIVNMSIRDMARGAGICCSSKIKFSLRQLEYSGNLEIRKENGKRIFIINTNDENAKVKDARSTGENITPGAGKKGSIPHTFIKL